MPWSEAVIGVSKNIRDTVVEFQSSRGVNENQKFSFMEVCKALCLLAYQAMISILTMICNILPIMECFAYFLRFVLDKLIEVLETENLKDRVFKSAVFLGETLILSILLYFIISILMIPVIYFTYGFAKAVYGTTTFVRKSN